MVNTKKFSDFVTGDLADPTNVEVGISNGDNAKFSKTTEWTTATRPVPPFESLLGYNTDMQQYEFYDGTQWQAISSGGSGTVTQINTGTGLTCGPITNTGTVSFAPIAANSLWANITGGSAVPTVIPTATFLLTANNLSDVPSKPTARTNLGLAIGTDVEAWNAQLDQIAAGTWPGANSITTLGTVVFGTWQSVNIGLPYGGTNASLTASNGGIVYSTATAMAILSGTATASLPLLSGSSSAPTWGAFALNLGGALTTAGALATTGAFSTTFNFTGPTNVTFPTSGTLLTSAGTITNADNIGITNDTTTNATMFLTWVTANTGYLPAKVTSTKLTFNPSTGVLSATAFTGTWTNAAALTKTDDTNVTLTLGGTPTTALLAATSLTLGWTGQLSVARGGTALASITAHNLIIGNGTGTPALLAPSATSGIPLVSQGAAANPVYGTAVVSGGGTGNTTFTAFAVICAGTTATGAFQNVSGVGAVGQVLTSNGAGALPTWQNVTGTGTVNSGTANQLAYYATTGTAVSGLTSANNGILATNGSGVPSITTALPSGVVASGVDQVTATSTTVAVTPGVQQFHPSAVKVWVTWTTVTTTTILKSYNVTSLTDNGVGSTTINFTVSFVNTNYCYTFGGNNSPGFGAGIEQQAAVATPATGSCRFISFRFTTDAAIDMAGQTVLICGDQ